MCANRGPRKSDVTREAIRAAARERFAIDGYERATIRAIAAQADIDPAMVMRYFGSKEKLFAAAAEFDLKLPDMSLVPTERIGVTLAEHFLNRWEADETLTALLRAATTHPAAAERTHAIFAGQVAPLAAKLCPDPAQAPTRAGLVATQVLGVALCRFILRIPPVVAISGADLVSWLGGTLQRYLTAAAPAPADGLVGDR